MRTNHKRVRFEVGVTLLKFLRVRVLFHMIKAVIAIRNLPKAVEVEIMGMIRTDSSALNSDSNMALKKSRSKSRLKGLL